MGGNRVARRASLRLISAPRLLLMTLPWVAGVVLLKLVLESAGWTPFEVSPLLAGLVSAEVFLLGFLLAGTVGDYKESEKLPGDIAMSIEAIADDCLGRDDPRARACTEQAIELAAAVRDWLLHRRELEHVLSDLRSLGVFAECAPRMRAEQAAIRRTIVRIDAIRRTSFVAAGYAIAELTAALVVLGVLLTDLGPLDDALFFSGVLTLLLSYVFALIRDLDDPFRFAGGVEGAADVSLITLEETERRLREELSDLSGRAPIDGRIAAVPAAPNGVRGLL